MWGSVLLHMSVGQLPSEEVSRMPPPACFTHTVRRGRDIAGLRLRQLWSEFQGNFVTCEAISCGKAGSAMCG